MMPKFPERKASEIASGTLASFSTTWARISCSRHRHRPAFLGLGLGTSHIGFGLRRLKLGADVLAYIDIGDIDREDLERRAGIQTLLQHRLGDSVRILQHALVADRTADGSDDSLADAGDDRLFRGAANEPLNIRPDGHPGLGPELNTILGHGVDGVFTLFRIGAINHLGIDAGLNRIQDIASGQIDGRGRLAATGQCWRGRRQ